MSLHLRSNYLDTSRWWINEPDNQTKNVTKVDPDKLSSPIVLEKNWEGWPPTERYCIPTSEGKMQLNAWSQLPRKIDIKSVVGKKKLQGVPPSRVQVHCYIRKKNTIECTITDIYKNWYNECCLKKKNAMGSPLKSVSASLHLTEKHNWMHDHSYVFQLT